MATLASSKIEGFYLGYFTAAHGQGVAVFAFREGVIVGLDISGVRFDGTYDQQTEADTIKCSIKVILPPYVQLIQGGTTGPKGMTYKADFVVNINDKEDFARVETPAGPVNLRLERFRGLEAHEV